MTSSSLRPPDLAALTARLVDVPSVSGDEGALANLIADELKPQCPPCDLVRLGNNLDARNPPGTLIASIG